MKENKTATFVRYCLLTIALYGLSGCALFEIHEEVTEYEISFGLVGKIVGSDTQDEAVIVVLYRETDGKMVASQYQIADSTMHYSFIVREGRYSLGAFEDVNGNLSYDSGERFGLYGKPGGLKIQVGGVESTGTKAVQALDIDLAQASEYPEDYPRRISDGSLVVRSYKKLGVVTDFADPVFHEKNGSLGYWKPVSFLKKIGIGIFFLEKYDPDKSVILFVHGATGTPTGWKPIVDHLDRTRYQPWFFYYPSGGRLNMVADSLNRFVKELHREYHFKSMHVVAHSMGGLVSRSFIFKNLRDRHDYIQSFISISTPWGGIKAAAKGVQKSPGVIPSWYDVATGSAFLEQIYAESLNGKIDFHLFFGIKGKCSKMMGNNDGTVEIASEIDYRAQDDAVRLYPFNEGHMSILASNRVMQLLNQLLQ